MATAAGEGEGTLTSDVEDGEVFLKNERETVRLRWAKGDAERERTVPAGTYRLHGYRIVQGGWMISTTGGKGQVSVSPGKTQQVTPEGTIQLGLKARRQGGEIKIQLGITSQHMGLSIYTKGKRIPMPYTLLDAEGNELASGKLGYG